MTDERLRKLERKWRETQSPRDEAKYLTERVRVGTLPSKRLRLLARLGHDPARMALGLRGRRRHVDFTPWLKGLARFGDDVLARAYVVAVRALLAKPKRAYYTEDGPLIESVRVTEAWLHFPSEANREAACEAVGSLWDTTSYLEATVRATGVAVSNGDMELADDDEVMRAAIEAELRRWLLAVVHA